MSNFFPVPSVHHLCSMQYFVCWAMHTNFFRFTFGGTLTVSAAAFRELFFPLLFHYLNFFSFSVILICSTLWKMIDFEFSNLINFHFHHNYFSPFFRFPNLQQYIYGSNNNATDFHERNCEKFKCDTKTANLSGKCERTKNGRA